LYYTDSRVSSYLSTNGFATQTDIVAAITDSAPVTLDTLNELAAALGDDPNFATTTATSLGLKAPLASPSFTGNATFAGSITLSQNGTNFEHGYAGNGLVLSHYNIGPSNAIVSGGASNPDVLFINNGGSANDWSNVSITGNVGINETNPLGKLHIKVSDTGVTSPSAQGNLLVLEDSENGLSILSSTAGAGYINFGDSDDNNVGMIIYGHSSNSMDFWTNAGKRMTINSGGDVGIGEPNPASDLVVRADSAGGRGGEITILNYASNTVGNEAALNFGLENSTYAGDAGNAQIKAIISGSSAATDLVFTNWSGSAFNENMRISSSGDVLISTNGKFLQGKRNSGSAIIDMIGFGAGTDTLQIKGGTSGGANAISFYDTGGFLGTFYNSNFGIGVTSPGAKLHVVDGNNYAQLGDLQGNSTMSLRMADNAGSPVEVQAYGAELRFNTSTTSGATPSVKMNITPAGNVGIGTTNPTNGKLEVQQTATTAALWVQTGGTTDSYTIADFRTGTNAPALAIKGNGQVGIGTTSPNYKLTVQGDVNNIFTYSTGVNDQPGFVAANNTTTGTSTNTLYNKLYGSNVSATVFGVNIANYALIGTEGSINNGILLGTLTAKPLIIGTNNTERMRILSSGGITFNGDTAAANALDDYEEGTWTPDIHGSTTRGTVSYQFRSGSYTKIGNRVWCRFGFKLSSISGATGRVRVDGLPFASRSYGSYQEPNFSVSTGLLATTDNAYKARMFVVNSSSYLEGRISVNTDTIWNISDFGGDEWIILAFHYETHI